MGKSKKRALATSSNATLNAINNSSSNVGGKQLDTPGSSKKLPSSLVKRRKSVGFALPDECNKENV